MTPPRKTVPWLKALLATTIVGAYLSAGCVDPAEKFSEFDNRVYDAAKSVVATGCPGGVVPDVSGEFFLSLSPAPSPESLLKLIITTEIDLTTDPALLSLTFQPLCVQEDQCTVGQPIGDPHVETGIEVSNECSFELDIPSIIIPGGGNALSGAEIDGELQLLGNLQSEDFYCGIVNGIANAGGIPVPIDNSTFGAVRITPGTLGDDLPTPVPACPSDQPEFDAGVPDAGLADAGMADAT